MTIRLARTRSSGAFKPQLGSIWNQYSNCSHLLPTKTGDVPLGVTGTTKVMMDVSSKDAVKRLRQGHVVMNPLDVVTHSIESSCSGHRIKSIGTTCSSPVFNIHWWLDGDTLLRSLSGGSNSPIMPMSVLPGDEVENLLKFYCTKALANRGMGTKDANLWESIGELNKLAGLWKNLGGRFLNVVRRPIKSPADEYLLYKYGLRPVLSDIAFLANRHLDVLRGFEQRIRTSTFGEMGDTTPLTQMSSSAATGLGNVTYTREAYEYISVKPVIIDAVAHQGVHQLASWGLSPKGLLTLGWELSPMSFIADWAFNVGDYLRAISPAIGYEKLGSCMVVRNEKRTAYVANGFEPPAGYVTVQSPQGNLVVNQTTVRRTAMLGPSLGPSVVLAQYQKSTNWDRAGTLFALAAQALTKRAAIVRSFARG